MNASDILPVTASDVLTKAKDSSGHEHGSDGKFTSSGGNSYSTKKTHDNGFHEYHAVLDSKGTTIGSVAHAHGSTKHEAHLRGVEGKIGVHEDHATAALHVANKHERNEEGKAKPKPKYREEKVGTETHLYDGKEHTGGVVKTRRDKITGKVWHTSNYHGKALKNHDNHKDAMRAVKAHHEAQFGKATGVSTAGDLLGRAPQVGKAADVFAKSIDVATPLPGYGAGTQVAGSMEHFCSTVRDPLIAGCGCPFAGELDDTGALTYDYEKNRQKPRHYPNVEATFHDKGIVSCRDCAKTWAVPFTFSDGESDKASVLTGEPEERLQAYISPEHLENDEAEDNGDEEVVD
jgi:hypothetical protein